MPPPSSVPQWFEITALSLTSELQDADDSQTRRSSVEPQRAIPNIVSTRVSTPITVGSSRKPVTPVSIGLRSSPIPTPKPSRKSRRIKKSPIPYDPDQPGIDLDPTVVTMASICVDTGQGRVSSKANEVMKNHVAWKASNRERRAQMVVEMEAKKYGKSLDSGATPNHSPPTSINPPPREANGSAPLSEPTTGDNDFDYSQTMSASKFNVQVRIGPNGETVVDEESLFVDNSAEEYTHGYTHVEESDTTTFVNSATHSKKLRGSRWSAMETELFYDVRSFLVLHSK